MPHAVADFLKIKCQVWDSRWTFLNAVQLCEVQNGSCGSEILSSSFCFLTEEVFQRGWLHSALKQKGSKYQRDLADIGLLTV